MANVGDKFVIEIDKVFKDCDGRMMYRIKGFNSLVFDENGIDKLTPYKEPEKAAEPEKELTPAVGMVYQHREDNNFRVVVTGVDFEDCTDCVAFVACDTGSVGTSEQSEFLRSFKNTGENVSYYLDVVLGRLPF